MSMRERGSGTASDMVVAQVSMGARQEVRSKRKGRSLSRGIWVLASCLYIPTFIADYVKKRSSRHFHDARQYTNVIHPAELAILIAGHN